jgi:hypothetical protein
VPRIRDITTTATALVGTESLAADPASGPLSKVTPLTLRKFVGPHINVKDSGYGAVGDYTTDDTAAIQAAIDAVGAPAVGVDAATLWFPPGTYRVTATLNINRKALRLLGAGVGNPTNFGSNVGSLGTTLIWDGTAGIPMFQVRDAIMSGFENLLLIGKDAAPPSALINYHCVVATDTIGTNQYLWIDRCWLGVFPWTQIGSYSGLAECGVEFTGDDGNNDQFYISQTVFNRCSEAGLKMPNTQSIWGSLHDVTFEYCARGIDTGAALSGYNVQFNHTTTCDIRCSHATWNPKLRIDGYYSEYAAKLIEVGPFASVTIDGGIVKCDSISGTYMIDCYPSRSGQQLSLKNLEFQLLPTVTTPKLRMKTDGSGLGTQPYTAGSSVDNLTKLIVEDCHFLTPQHLDVDGVSGDRRAIHWRSSGQGFDVMLEGATALPTLADPFSVVTSGARLDVTTATTKAQSLANGNVPLTATGLTGQTAPLLDFFKGGTKVAFVRHDGLFAIPMLSNVADSGPYMLTSASTFGIYNRISVANDIVTINGMTGQTGAMLKLSNDGGTVMAEFTATGGLKMLEQTDPAAPAANNAILYVKDNGSGKSQLVVRFPTGAVQILATEP